MNTNLMDAEAEWLPEWHICVDDECRDSHNDWKLVASIMGDAIDALAVALKAMGLS